MGKKNKADIKGDGNEINQVEKQVFFYNFGNLNNYIPDEYASQLLRTAIMCEENPRIIYTKTLGGRTIQCGSGSFSVSSSSKTEREMEYWEDALRKLENNDYIIAAGNKHEVFKITKKGYEYYDKYLK